MTKTTMLDLLWGSKAKLRYLFIPAIILLFSFLGVREVWTQEHRWADIVSGMFYRHDFLHPYLGDHIYYDKPLLSYWFIAFLVKLTGVFNTWILRLPSACAGLIAIFSIYKLGAILKNKQLGLLSGWLLLTTFYFVYWARVSSADMLNLAGSLVAVAWYFARRENPRLVDYTIFFIVLALTSLCKGLVGAIIPLLAVFTDICLHRSFGKYAKWQVFLCILPGLILYFLPFFISAYFNGGELEGNNGLYLVYKENILRFFKPFDHQGSIATYFIFLPIYLLPWTFLFFPAVLSLPKRYKYMTINSKWIVWTSLFIFLFFTLSGSRRNYYILPLIPFTILFIADWILSQVKRTIYLKSLAHLILYCALLIFLVMDVMPVWYYQDFGVQAFSKKLQKEVAHIKPWSSWDVVMLDAETKLPFYLNLSPTTKNYNVIGDRRKQTCLSLEKIWPILKNKPQNTIFITRAHYLPCVQDFFQGYELVKLKESKRFSSYYNNKDDASVAFVPASSFN